jgi:signal transduction histidine kinase
LVVDDDEGLNKLAQKALRRSGFETLGVLTGTEALARVSASPDLILLLDQRLPDMSGSELIHALIAQDRRVPFVAMTGHGDEQIAVEMMKLGAKDYLVKGLDLKDLLPEVFHRVFRELEVERQLGLAERNLRESEAKEKEARLAAEASNRAKSEFLANMSHEIRTPLNGILGMLQLLGATPLGMEQREYVQAAVKSSKRLTRLLSDILDLSRVEAGKLVLEKSEFSLKSQEESVLELFTEAANEKGLELDVLFAPRLPAAVIGDDARLRQILFNLVGNAIKFTRKGYVRVEASPLENSRDHRLRILFTVKDTGVGIPEDRLQDIFEPFVQADGSYTRRFQGAGLGLSIVRKLVRLMDGELALESAEGEGTTVYLSLPFALPGPRHDQAEAAAPGAAPRIKRPLRVLFAEDEEVNLMAGKRMLEKSGYAVTTATNGHEVLKLLAERDFDLIIMDVQMPGLDGVEATKRIRACGAAYANIPIIAMTAYAMTGDKEKILAAGMDDYLAKPVDLAGLNDVILRVCNRGTPP